MRSKSDKLPKQKKFVIAAILSAVIFMFSFAYIEKRVRYFSEQMGTYYCKSQISQSISKSVRNALEDTDARYSDMSVEVYDEEGKFVSSELCTKNINVLQSIIISDVNSSIAELAENDVKISAGTLSGMVLLKGKGPSVKFKLLPVGSAETDLKSEFQSAGINQVCHKISLDIKVDVKALYPTGSETVTVSMNCILAESIFAGEVPEGGIAVPFGGSINHSNQNPE